MLQFKNSTPFEGAIYLMPDAEGVDTAFAVVKATLRTIEQGAIAEEQVPVVMADEYHGKPGVSSIKTPSDVCLIKPGTDVLLLGTAHAPGGRPTTQMDVSLSVGQIRKTVRVLGDRVWRKSGITHSVSQPEPFEAMPLIWERAFGGIDKGKDGLRGEPRNPVGCGFRAPDSSAPLEGLRLPNLEDPADLITSWKQKPAPACFAPIGPQWQPRLSYAGTYDEKWQQRRAPYLPADFDARFFQLAPPGLVSPGFVRPGEQIEVRGATPGGELRFRLPPVRIEITYLVGGAPQPVPANLDTILVEPDLGRVQVVWRAALRCDKKALQVSEIRAAALKAA